MEEAQLLRRRHGREALSAARATLERSDVTSWGRRVMTRAVKLLRTRV